MAAYSPGERARQALLMVWTDIFADVEHDFNDWYNREHVRERVEVPGFIRARRFAARFRARPSTSRYTKHETRT